MSPRAPAEASRPSKAQAHQLAGQVAPTETQAYRYATALISTLAALGRAATSKAARAG